MARDDRPRSVEEVIERLSPGDGDVLGLFRDRPAWMKDAACRERPDLDWYARCLVRNECEVYGITHEAPAGDGVWGGLSAADRREMRRGAA